MPKSLATGDRIQIADREPAPADVKSQLFYAHYRGVRGTVAKLYPDGTALIMADMESLPADTAGRHEKGTAAMRQKWLDGLSEEARNKLSAAEKKFSLRYAILVGQDDIRAEGSAAPASVKAVMPAPAEPVLNLDIGEVPRKSLEDIEADEARHLSEIRQQKGRA